MNTYLIISDTIYFRDSILKELKKDIDNIITFNLAENTLDEVLEEASYFSMFAEEKCIIIKNANFFLASKKDETKKNKEDSDKLKKYLAKENELTKLIFIVDGKVDTKKSIYNTIKEHNHVYENTKMTKTEMKNILSQIVTDHKFTVDDKSLWYILNNSLSNLDLAIAELNKIFNYYDKPCHIAYEDVLNLVCKSVTENNFKLVDSIISKNLEESLINLEEIKLFKVEPTVILSLLYREFKLMLSTLLYRENRYNIKEILINLKLAEWQFNKVDNNLRMYNKEEIMDNIVKLAELDYKCKSGLINKDVVLIEYIFWLC